MKPQNKKSSPSLLPNMIIFGLSSGIGYAITKAMLSNRHFVVKYQSENQPSCNGDDENIEYNPPSLLDKISHDIHSKWKQFLRSINTKRSSSSLVLLSVLLGTHYTCESMSNTTLLPLFYYCIIHQIQNDKDDDNNKDDDDDDADDETENNQKDNQKVKNGTNVPKISSLPKEENLKKEDEEEDDDDDDKNRKRSNSVLTQTSENSYNSSSTNPLQAENMNPAPPTRYLEMLVHNVSHTDLVLCLGIPCFQNHEEGKEHNHGDDNIHPPYTPRMDNTSTSTNNNHDTSSESKSNRNTTVASSAMKKETDAHALCRPRFSAFDIFCKRILYVLKENKYNHHDKDNINKNSEDFNVLLSSIMSFPRYERSDATPRFSLVTPRPSRQSMLPVGINLAQLVSKGIKGGKAKKENDNIEKDSEEGNTNNNHLKTKLDINANDLQSLRLRGKDMSKLESYIESTGYEYHMMPSPRTRLINKDSHDESKKEHHTNTNIATDYNEDDGNLSSSCQDHESILHLEAVFFPLLSSLLRKWQKQISEKYNNPTMKKNVKKVLMLVTGVGTPRNWTHSMTGNSTQICAEIMEIFIHILYPDVTVVKLHSEREIYRYDENITFAQKELLPCIDEYRDAHARGEPYPDEHPKSSQTYRPFDPDWKQTFYVTLSFADGAPARTHAIQSALRPYRPTYFHFWQLKTFWHDSKICDDDIEVHSFESMETVPAMEVHKTSSHVQLLVDEMLKFRHHFVQTLKEGHGSNDIKTFWLRKSKKPVLAVLLVNRPGQGGLIMYRGTNMEVSMPTGSLCAERNVIGTALATNPGLRREDLMMVAVLAVPLQGGDDEHQSSAPSPLQLPSPPPGVNSNQCTYIDIKAPSLSGRSSLGFFSEIEEKLHKFQRPENIRRSMSLGSFSSIIECDDSYESDESWVIDGAVVPSKGISGVGDVSTTSSSNLEVEANSEGTDEYNISEINKVNPVRKIRLHNDYDDGNMEDKTNYGNKEEKVSVKKTSKPLIKRKKKRSVLVHSPEDINPLKPCGACNEWLKKIAECNPNFKIITFTDTECNGVYVSPCQE